MRHYDQTAAYSETTFAERPPRRGNIKDTHHDRDQDVTRQDFQTADEESFRKFKARVLAKLDGVQDGRLREQLYKQVLHLLAEEHKHWHREESSHKVEDILSIMDLVVAQHNGENDEEDDFEDEEIED